MALINIAVGVGLAIAGLIGATLSRLLADEAKAWTPRLVEFLIRKAVTNLPEDQRERRHEEWHSHINDTPGDLSKIVHSIGFIVASRELSYKKSFIVSKEEIAINGIRLKVAEVYFLIIFIVIIATLVHRSHNEISIFKAILTLVFGYVLAVVLLISFKRHLRKKSR